jgi:hypothetical protein
MELPADTEDQFTQFTPTASLSIEDVYEDLPAEEEMQLEEDLEQLQQEMEMERRRRRPSPTRYPGRGRNRFRSPSPDPPASYVESILSSLGVRQFVDSMQDLGSYMREQGVTDGMFSY